jgi:hypothetical protein
VIAVAAAVEFSPPPLLFLQSHQSGISTALRYVVPCKKQKEGLRMRCDLCTKDAKFVLAVYDLSFSFVRQSLAVCPHCANKITQRIKSYQKCGQLPQTTQLKKYALPSA